MNKKILIIGLGNPGPEYEKTKHNCGFMLVRYFIEFNQFPALKFDKQFNSLIAEKGDIIVALPQAFMNASGQVVKKIADYYSIKHQNIIVIHDEIDLPLGSYRKSQDKSSAGHKGVQSIIEHLKTKDFIRYRIGIAPSPEKKIKAEKIVLKKFSKKELEKINEVIKNAAIDIIATFDL